MSNFRISCFAASLLNWPRYANGKTWTSNRRYFLFYRFIMASYMCFWFLYGYITSLEKHFWQFVNYWNEAVITFYFIFAFTTATYSLRKNHTITNTDKLSWQNRFLWATQSTAATTALVISVLFWTLLARLRPAHKNITPVSLQQHVIYTLLMITDVFMVAFPVRILHFIYPCLCAVFYATFTIFLHAAGINSAIYPIFDYENEPRCAFLLQFFVTISTVFFQSVFFGIYQLKLILSKALQNRVSVSLPEGTVTADASIQTIQPFDLQSNQKQEFDAHKEKDF